MKKITAVLLGAGQRGAGAYAPYALAFPNELEFVAVAEPDEGRRKDFQSAHALPDERCFSDWSELLSGDRLADCAFICTQDRMHFAPTVKALESGYHVLLEKPMSSDAAECAAMGELAETYGRVLSICHVLRYTPFFTAIKEQLVNGIIGTPVSIDLIESVGYWHQAHSFVRGNWNNAETSSPMILAKSCHDMDILLWLMGRDCRRVSSFGSLTHFTQANAPDGAPERCLDGCPHADACPYYAPAIYLSGREEWGLKVFQKIVSLDTSREGMLRALQTGPYGRCVYRCDNTVVDHQVATMEFEGGATASFTMCGFTTNGSRTLKIMGTKGQIEADMQEKTIEVSTFLSGNRKVIHVNAETLSHGGGDSRLVRDFVRRLAEEKADSGRTSAKESVQSHIMALAAELSRVSGRPVELDAFLKSLPKIV